MAIGRIYKLTSEQTDKVYIGSTTQTISIRFSKHKNSYKKYLKNPSINISTAREMLQFEDCKIELIEELEYTDKKELTKREQHWINITQNTVNKNNPGLSVMQKRIKYKQQRTAPISCQCGKTIQHRNMSKHLITKKHILAVANMDRLELQLSEMII